MGNLSAGSRIVCTHLSKENVPVLCTPIGELAIVLRMHGARGLLKARRVGGLGNLDAIISHAGTLGGSGVLQLLHDREKPLPGLTGSLHALVVESKHESYWG